MLRNLALVTAVSLGASFPNAFLQPALGAPIQVEADGTRGGIDAGVADRSAWMRLAQDLVNPDKQAGPRSQTLQIPGGGAPRSLTNPQSASQSEGGRDNDLPSRAGTRTDTLSTPRGR